MEPKHINLDDWVLSGGGAQGESYFHKRDDGVLLKLLSPHLPLSLAEEEFFAAKDIYDAGFPCIKPLEVVTDGQRFGLIIPRIRNKVSFCTAVGKDPACLDDMARRLAKAGRLLHTTVADKTKFKSVLSVYRDLWRASRNPDKAYLAACDRILSDMERDDVSCTYLHGDFHFGNMITDGERDYMIDLGAFAYGNPLFDLSMFYFSTHLMPPGATEKVYHITDAQALEFWNAFKKYYYGGIPGGDAGATPGRIPDDACTAPGPIPDDADLERQFGPYLLLRTLLFESYIGLDSFQLDYCRRFLALCR